jgi:hypothetical protein
LAAWLEPTCVFAPANAVVLAKEIDEFIKTNTTFAVRSGGHAPTIGIALTNYGVLIAITNFKENTKLITKTLNNRNFK